MNKVKRLIKSHWVSVLLFFLFFSCMTGSLHTWIALAKTKLGLDKERIPAGQ